MVTSDEGITVHLTMIRSLGSIAVWEIRSDTIEVRGTDDCEFSYWVSGKRRGFEELAVQIDNRMFRPDTAGVPFGAEYDRSYRDLLVENGTLNGDYTLNLETATALGWDYKLPTPEELARAQEQELAWLQRQEPSPKAANPDVGAGDDQ